MWAILLSTLLLPPDPSPEPPPDAPKGNAPILLRAKVENDQIIGVRLRTTYQNEVRKVVKKVGDKTVEFAETVTVPVTTMVRETWDLKTAKISDGSGKKIDLESLRKRLVSESPVVISADGKPINKGYLEMLQKSAIVIVAPLGVARPSVPPIPLPPTLPPK